MEENSSIAPIDNSFLEKPRRGRPPKQNRQQPKFEDISQAIQHAGNQSSQEIETFSTGLTAGVRQWEEYQTKKIVKAINDAPVNVVNAVASELMEVQADLPKFQQLADQFCSIFSVPEQQSETE